MDCTLFYRFKLEKEKEEEEYVGNLLREEEIRF